MGALAEAVPLCGKKCAIHRATETANKKGADSVPCRRNAASRPAPFQLLPTTNLTSCPELRSPGLWLHCRRGTLVSKHCATWWCDTRWGLGWCPGGEGAPRSGGRGWGARWAQDSWVCAWALISRLLYTRWLPLNIACVSKSRPVTCA